MSEVKNKVIFLGGTCGDSTWREKLIPKLENSFFNPQLPKEIEWTTACQIEEEHQKEFCDICLYYITPETPSAYSIAEVVDDSNKRPTKVVFYYEGMEDHQAKAFKKIGEMVERNGGTWCRTYDELLEKLNS